MTLLLINLLFGELLLHLLQRVEVNIEWNNNPHQVTPDKDGPEIFYLPV